MIPPLRLEAFPMVLEGDYNTEESFVNKTKITSIIVVLLHDLIENNLKCCTCLLGVRY